MKSVLFIHRSVGHNLIQDGSLYELAAQATPAFAFSDYDHNLDILTDSSGKTRKMGFRFPRGNTNPADYATLFADVVHEKYRLILNLALGYDMVVIKSCYPNSRIKNDAELQKIQGYYKSIAAFFARRPGKKLVIITSPPLRGLRTSRSAARRARQLSDWLANTNLGPGVTVFNLFDLLANPADIKRPNVLRKEYRRRLPFDSHPNAEASRVVTPLLVKFLSKASSTSK